MTDLLHKLAPAVDKKWLHLAAGLMWSGVGMMLIAISAPWLQLEDVLTLLGLVLAGLALGTVIYLFGFSKVARKNIRRIASMPTQRNCIFAFQGWRTYPLVIFMVCLGIYLRVYSPFPKLCWRSPISALAAVFSFPACCVTCNWLQPSDKKNVPKEIIPSGRCPVNIKFRD